MSSPTAKDCKTFAQEIEKLAGADPIQRVVIGNLDYYFDDENPPLIPKDKKGIPLCWNQARPLLDYPYVSSFGSPQCHPVYVWTDKDIIFVSQYDGMTHIEKIPRHPGPCQPHMPGGG